MYTVILGFHSLLMEIPGAFVGRAARPFVEAPLVLAQTLAPLTRWVWLKCKIRPPWQFDIRRGVAIGAYRFWWEY